MQLEVGNILEGKITGITNFGAFVQLDENTTGLVHISEVATSYVKEIRDHISEGDVVKVKVMTVDKGGKISLSIKKAIEQDQGVPKREYSGKPRPARAGHNSFVKTPVPMHELSFEDKLSRFKSDSEERMSSVKKGNDSRRSGGYKRSSNTY